jgi:hypothetical protein
MQLRVAQAQFLDELVLCELSACSFRAVRNHALRGGVEVSRFFSFEIPNVVTSLEVGIGTWRTGMPDGNFESDAAIERKIVEMIGEKLAGILKEKTPSRICGLLTAKGRNAEWEKALDHIAEHFRPHREKPVHTIFRKKFRDKNVLKEYVRRAVSAPSTVRLSLLRDADARPVGSPCALIVREFNEALGEQSDEVCLVVIADFQGKLATAYPATKTMLG